MTRTIARILLKTLNRIWEINEGSDNDMSAADSKLIAECEALLSANGFHVCANHDGILIFSDGMD